MLRPLALVAVLAFLGVVTASALEPGAPQGRPGEIAPPPAGQTGPRTPMRDPASDNTEPTGTAIIRGYIVTLETGVPIRRAQVRAFASGLRNQRVSTTDSQGRFEFRDLPEGRYTLSATKGGYVTLSYGQRRPSQAGTPIELHDKQIIEKVMIGLPRGSVISGRITDEFGEPIPMVNVMPMQSRLMGGARRFVPAGQSDRTDDLGQFRLFGLSPGEYVISATYQTSFGGPNEQSEASQEPNGFAPTYFPGVSSLAEAQRITVGVGEESSSASFALIATRLVTVEGTVVGIPNGPGVGAMITLMPADPNNPGGMMMGPNNTGRMEPNGRWRIANVAPGRYMAQARLSMVNPTGGIDWSAATSRGMIGRTPVTVSGDKVENVTIVMTTGGRISGRIVTDGNVPPTFKPEEVNVFAGAVPGAGMTMFGGGGNARVKPDWSFQLEGLVEPRMVRAGGPQGWTAKAVLVNGRDYIDTPIEVQPGEALTGMTIVLTNKTSQVTGTVVDQRGRIVLDTSILVFPDDPKMWQFGSRYIRSVRPDQEGRYRVDMLPPFDEYLAVAVQDIEPGQGSDPAYLATVRAVATKFSVKEGESTTIDLKLKP
jgi:carboxypeptidase family protein